jgi:hypothetical protein
VTMAILVFWVSLMPVLLRRRLYQAGGSGTGMSDTGFLF